MGKTTILAATAALAVAVMALYLLYPAGGPATSEVTGSEVAGVDGNGASYLVPPEKIRSGGPGKDGIPSIDEPVFYDGANLDGSEIVMGIEIDGDARAYPLYIMVWHEIVNDVVGGAPLAVTYCPLCYTTQVFERRIDGQIVEFGTSGKLYNSNLVMYDRLTESYWSQALGLSIAGQLAGSELVTVPFDVLSWADWSKLYPDSLVLSEQTGHARPYGTDPYGDYYTSPSIAFPVENDDERLHPKEFVLGLDMDGHTKAYRYADIYEQKIINDMVGDDSILLASIYEGNARVFERTLSNQILEFEYVDGIITDVQTGSVWGYDGTAVSGVYEGRSLERLPSSPGFWFEWAAFHPDTQVYGL